jgi:oligopeptide transport system ATP-binding protein
VTGPSPRTVSTDTLVRKDKTVKSDTQADDLSSTEKDALVVTGLRKSYVTKRSILGRPLHRHDAVGGVDLRIPAGTTFAVVGESGAGKSTVGRLALRLIEPDSGSIELLGTDVTRLDRKRMSEFRSEATMIFQDPYTSLNPRMSIGASVAEPLIAAGTHGRRERNRKVGEALDAVGLRATHAERFPYEMSGGQLQRVAIARALISDPKFIVCDEPVAALDMSTQAQVINLLQQLQRERGLSYLFISHDLSLVRAVADSVAVMRNGKVVEQGSADQIYNSPSDPYTRLLLDAVPVGDPRKRRFRR